MPTTTDRNIFLDHLNADASPEAEAVAERRPDPLFAAHVLAVVCERVPEIVAAVIDDLEAI